MKMVRLEGGTFRMGSPENEPGHNPDEGPVHTPSVTLRGPFFMSTTEVTNGGSTSRLMGGHPLRLTRSQAARPEHLPVDSVTWDEAAVEFCRKLTEKEKNQPWARKNWEYRLPHRSGVGIRLPRVGTDGPTAFGELGRWCSACRSCSDPPPETRWS